MARFKWKRDGISRNEIDCFVAGMPFGRAGWVRPSGVEWRAVLDIWVLRRTGFDDAEFPSAREAARYVRRAAQVAIIAGESHG